jgi:hypothetical protein
MVPRIRWRFDLHMLDAVDGIECYREVTRSLQQGMPKMSGQGRLAVEEYSYAAERTEWRSHFSSG